LFFKILLRSLSLPEKIIYYNQIFNCCVSFVKITCPGLKQCYGFKKLLGPFWIIPEAGLSCYVFLFSN